MNTPQATGIKAIVRKQILESMIRSVTSAPSAAGKWKVLILDSAALKIVNAAVKMNELMDENITLVETLEKRRQPYPNLEAIYFVSPTIESVTRIIEDFTRNKYNRDGRLYYAAHLFFITSLDDRLFYKLKSSTANAYIKTCKELYMDFHALESNVFTLSRPHALITFFGSEVTGEQVTKEYMGIAKQICSFCVTLNEFPVIRYAAVNGFDRITKRMAALINDELEKYCRVDEDFPSKDPAVNGPNKAQLIIVDRSVDILAPLLHEFTYQAMANDLLPLVDGGTKYRYTYHSNVEGKKEKEALLDASQDPMWASIRHTHIADCIQSLLSQFNKFVEDNPSATGGKSGGDTVNSLRELKEKLASVPQFQELKSKFSVHLNMVQECMHIFTSRKLAEVGGVEQDLATGETADGETPKQIEIKMIPLLDDPAVNLYDKVRMLMVYIIGKSGVKEDDRRKLFEHANITSELVTAITNLSLLGVKLSTDQKRKNPKKDKKKKKNEDDVAYELSRYVPVIKNLMTDLCDGVLKNDVFPYIKDPALMNSFGGRAGDSAMSGTVSSLSSVTSSSSNQPTSLRSTKPSWHTKKASTEAAPTKGAPPEEEKKKGGKIILFVVGGMTFSEIRSVYELGKAFRKEIIIGSTHSTTPSQFIDDLKVLRLPLVIPEKQESIPMGSTSSLSNKQGGSNSSVDKDKKKFLGLKFKGLKIGSSKNKDEKK